MTPLCKVEVTLPGVSRTWGCTVPVDGWRAHRGDVFTDYACETGRCRSARMARRCHRQDRRLPDWPPGRTSAMELAPVKQRNRHRDVRQPVRISCRMNTLPRQIDAVSSYTCLRRTRKNIEGGEPVRGFLAVCLGVALWISIIVPSRAESRLALVIGNSAYVRVTQLANPVKDARAMDQALRGFGFNVIRLENASKAQIEAALAEFMQRLTPDTVSIVYYAGHGIQISGRNFLIPVEARIEDEADIQNQTVDLGSVLYRIAGTHSKATIVILDACRNNPFDQPGAVAAIADENGRALKPKPGSRFRSVAAGLAPVDAPSGVFIAYATAPGHVAADGEGTSGLYTGELIRAMTTVTSSIEEVFKKTRLAVIRQSSGRQIPWESSSLTISFTFRLGALPSISLSTDGPYDGAWVGTFNCAALGDRPSYSVPFAFEVRHNEIVGMGGEKAPPGTPGYQHLEGTVGQDGHVLVKRYAVGTGLIPGKMPRGEISTTPFDDQFSGDTFTAREISDHDCYWRLTRHH
jgi:hypothetical protein